MPGTDRETEEVELLGLGSQWEGSTQRVEDRGSPYAHHLRSALLSQRARKSASTGLSLTTVVLEITSSFS